MNSIEETETRFYQPTDSEGNSIGLPIEYLNQKDLQKKLTTATQRMKFITSRDKVKAPDSAPRFSAETLNAEQVKRDVAAFLKETPGYHSCPSNFKAIAEWIDHHGLNPELSTFKLAFEELSKNGLLLDASGKPMSTADTTGISYTTKSGKVFYGRAAIEAMPADEYKRRLNTEHGFADRVERVLARR
jgi:hypothetical protein